MEPQPAALRAMRAWIELNQADAAAAIGISKRTLVDAEMGRVLTDKTWDACVGFYAQRGLHWLPGPGPSAIVVAKVSPS